MTTDTLRFVNIIVESWGVLFCLLAGTILLITPKIERPTRNYFLLLFSLLLADLLSNLAGLLLRGRTDTIGNLALHAANLLEYSFGYALPLSLTLYLLSLIGKTKPQRVRPWRWLVWGIFGTALLLLAISQFNGMYYSIDASGIYHRGAWFWLSQVIAIGFLLLDLVLVVRYRTCLSRGERISFSVYIFVPIAALLLQLRFYGIYFLLLASTIAAVFMLGTMILEQTERYYQAQQELTRMRSAIVLSQVKPHFLYNSLTAIAQLCEKEPATAKQAAIAFANYLRTNMSALDQVGLVPFEKELSHIKTYLFLEQLRFGEDLQVVLDLGVTAFSLPPLTVQPLVENAVKWGVGRKAAGGTVTLTTRTTPQGIELTVADDGVGFDPQQPPSDGKQHLGIQIVRSRLNTCGASLELNSTPGRGTVARIQFSSAGTIRESSGLHKHFQ